MTDAETIIDLRAQLARCRAEKDAYSIRLSRALDDMCAAMAKRKTLTGIAEGLEICADIIEALQKEIDAAHGRDAGGPGEQE